MDARLDDLDLRFNNNPVASGSSTVKFARQGMRNSVQDHQAWLGGGDLMRGSNLVNSIDNQSGHSFNNDKLISSLKESAVESKKAV